MVEYIERNALIAEFKRLTLGENSLVERLFADGVYAVIETFPAADVAEVRNGRWIPEACESVSKRNRLIEYRVYSCSICGRSNGRVKKKYCPNCGARMGKEDKHEAG